MARGEQISVGMTASITGRYSLQGRQALAGARAWTDDTNRAGGIWVNDVSTRLPVRLIYYDDESNSDLCQELTERLISEDQVNILIGPYSSGLALRAASVASRHKRVLWNHGGASESIFERGGGWAIGILTPDTSYFNGVIDFAVSQNPSLSRVAIVYSTAGAFPRGVALGAESHCEDIGIHTVSEFTYQARTEDFSSILKQIEREGFELVLGVGRIEDDIRFAQQYVAWGMQARLAALIAAGIELFGQTLGPDSDGFLASSQWEAGAVSNPDYGPSEEKVLSSLSRRDDIPVDYPMAQSYAGCLVAQRCIEEAGTLDNEKLRITAGGLDFTTFYGRFSIEPETGRQIGHVMPVVQWQHGRKVAVWPPR